MLSRFGIEASQAAWYVIAFAIILVLLALMGWLMRKYGGGRLMLPGQDRGRARQPRLGVVDIYDLDRQRQLILLRRDNVEHLLLIGGPNDLVVENNIIRAAGARLPSAPGEPSLERLEPSFERPPEVAARPQVEPAARAALENQPAARLGPSLEPALAPEKVAAASQALSEPVLQARREPMLKPDRIVADPAAVTPLRPAANRRAEAPQPSGEAKLRPAVPPAPAPEAPPPQRPAEPFALRATNLPQDRAAGAPGPASSARESRPATPRPQGPAAPSHGTAAPPAPPPRGPDAALLSDMARQLEEALRRPTRPAPGEARPRPPETARGPLDEDPVEAAPSRSTTPPQPGRVPPAPARNAPTAPAPGPTAGPASPPIAGPVPAPQAGAVPAPPSPWDRTGPEIPARQEPAPVQGPVLPPRPQPSAAAIPAAPPRAPFAGPPGPVAMPMRAPEPAKPAPEARPPAAPVEEKAAAAPERPRQDDSGTPVAKSSQEKGARHAPPEPEAGSVPPPPEKAPTDPLAAAMASKPSAPPPPAAAPEPAPRPASDPFSVEEIEAEFARLLGRSDGGSKP